MICFGVSFQKSVFYSFCCVLNTPRYVFILQVGVGGRSPCFNTQFRNSEQREKTNEKKLFGWSLKQIKDNFAFLLLRDSKKRKEKKSESLLAAFKEVGKQRWRIHSFGIFLRIPN